MRRINEIAKYSDKDLLDKAHVVIQHYRREAVEGRCSQWDALTALNALVDLLESLGVDANDAVTILNSGEQPFPPRQEGA